MSKHTAEYDHLSLEYISDSIVGIKNGDVAFGEPIICFLERDEYVHGSGYKKEKIWRYLLRLRFSEKQKERLRQVALHYIHTRIGREFFPMCRFTRGIADDQFRAQIHELQNSSDKKIQRRAMIMAAYLKSIKEGEAAREESILALGSRTRRGMKSNMRIDYFLLQIGKTIMRLPEVLKQKKDRAGSARETAEIMNDPGLMALLLQSIQEADEGKLVAWEDVKLELGL